jgi:amino acid transporter
MDSQLIYVRAPTAGGQYHWVSEFAPKSCQRFLSYIVGWLCVLGWQSGAASSAFLAGTEIQGLIILNHATYVPKRWHGTLLVIAVVIVCGFFNTVLARRLPLVEKCVLVLHVLGFFGIMIPLLVLAPRSTSREVWTTFNDAGWGSKGLSCLVGILAPVVALLGSDAATHMSEELKDASRTLPKAMVATLVVNGAMGFGMLLTFVYCLGDIDEAVNTPTGYPFIEVFSSGVKSTRGATAMTSIMIILSCFCCITNVASSSRQLFAFARDHGVPFSKFFAYVSIIVKNPDSGGNRPLFALANLTLGSCEVGDPSQLRAHDNDHPKPPLSNQHRLNDRLQSNHVPRCQRPPLFLPHLSLMCGIKAMAQRAFAQAKLRFREGWSCCQYLLDLVLGAYFYHVVSLF